MSAPEDVRMAYQFAMDHPDIMMWMPCYCGCGGHAGHKSAKNCFIKESSTADNVQFDEHGASCQMCVTIALDTKAMLEEGRSLKEMRTYIDDKFGDIGPGTHADAAGHRTGNKDRTREGHGDGATLNYFSPLGSAYASQDEIEARYQALPSTRPRQMPPSCADAAEAGEAWLKRRAQSSATRAAGSAAKGAKAPSRSRSRRRSRLQPPRRRRGR
jgi:hypothetical protein